MCRSAAAYGGWLRRAIHLFKYEGEPARAASLAPLLIAAAQDFPEIDVIVPVPLHSSRQRRRGYNQAELLAAPLGRELQRPIVRLLIRTRSTDQQAKLDAEARRRNVEDAFQAPEPRVVAGRRVLLVDDVLTTGSTLNACADALHAAGASWIGVLTLARDV